MKIKNKIIMRFEILKLENKMKKTTMEKSYPNFFQNRVRKVKTSIIACEMIGNVA